MTTWLLPDDLITTLDRLEVTAIEIVHRNAWKRSMAVRCVDASGQTRFVKWFAADAPTIALAGHRREISALRARFQPELMPRLLGAGERHLMTEWLDGRTLRQELDEAIRRRDGSSAAGALATVLEALAPGYAGALEAPVQSPRRFAAAAREAWRFLAASGPIDATRFLVTDVWVRGLARLACPAIERVALRATTPAPRVASVGRTHGDLHLDNVILLPDASIRLVDYAASRVDGAPAIDLVLLLAIVLAMTAPTPSLHGAVIEAATAVSIVDPVTDRAIMALARELSVAGRANSRFARGGAMRFRSEATLRLVQAAACGLVARVSAR